MKPLLIFLIICSTGIYSIAQTYVNTSSSLPLHLLNAISSCGSFSGPSLTFNVPLSANGQVLTQIELIFEQNPGELGMSLGFVDMYLVDNLGGCYHFVNTSTSDFTNSLDYIAAAFVSADHSSCLNTPNLSNLGSGDNGSDTVSGNYGLWASEVNFPSHTNVSGTWSIYFDESTSREPDVTGATLEFGGAQYATNQIGNGDLCIDPIVWDGQPICATTGGATTDSNAPGNALTGLGNTYDFVNGGNCQWMLTLENDIWIEFTVDTTGPVCISLSGLDGSTQSIVVSDANADGDNNPCTGSGFTSSDPDPNWVVESCPDPDIYITNGTSTHQQHCFDAVVGETYYLVIDGTGGAESPFYVDGTSGAFSDPPTPMPVELFSFKGKEYEGYNVLSWITASEHNNDYFELQRTTDGIFFESIDIIKGNGTTLESSYYSSIDRVPLQHAYYRLKQVDYDGKFEYSKLILLENVNKTGFKISPNPVASELSIFYNTKNIPTELRITDYTGTIVFQEELNDNLILHTINVSLLNEGVYIAQLVNSDGIKKERFIKQ